MTNTDLPNWIYYSQKEEKYKVNLKPFICQNPNCKYIWYPKIKNDSYFSIPDTCPKCKTKAYRKIRISK